jgi:anti-sigma factor RsiW
VRCAEAQEILVPADEPRITDAAVERALAHAERCPACRASLERDRRVAALIRAALPRPAAPAALRERVCAALANERARTSRHGGTRLGRHALAAVPAAAAALLALWAVRSDPAREPADAFVQDYLRKMVAEDAVESSDPAVVAAFLARELGIAFRPPASPGARLERAEICLLDGRRGALLEYRIRDRRLSYYVVPRGDGVAPRRRPEARTVHLARRGPVHVVVWSDSSFAHAVLGDPPVEELVAFAHAAGGY